MRIARISANSQRNFLAVSIKEQAPARWFCSYPQDSFPMPSSPFVKFVSFRFSLCIFLPTQSNLGTIKSKLGRVLILDMLTELA